MAIQLIPVSSKASLPTAINTLNTVIRQISANASVNVINQGGGRAVMSGKIKTGQYGEVFYDKNGIARILIGQNSSGEPVIAMSGDSKSILESTGCWSLGKLTSNRYGQLLYDATGKPRLVIGQDSNSDPMIALSSGSNSVLTNEKIKIGKLNSTRYGQLFKDSSGTARMVIGEDTNGDPMIALSSGSNSVLTSGKERFKIYNLGSNRYAQVSSDSSDRPRMIFGQSPSDGEPVLAITKSGYNVITELSS